MADWKFWALVGLAIASRSRDRSDGRSGGAIPPVSAGAVAADEWQERASIGKAMDWFWEPLGSQHVARYLWARQFLGPGAVLDVACGTGYGAAILRAPNRRVVGVDISEDAIAAARRDHGSYGVEFVAGDAMRLPLEDVSVDSVVSFETIEHLASPGQFTAELARVLKPGGTLLLSTPDRSVYSRGTTDGRSRNPYHPSEMTRAELVELLEPRFAIRHMLGQELVRIDVQRSRRPRGAAWRAASRSLVKGTVRVATAPLLRSESVARWLFPHLRRQHVPRSTSSRESMYLIVHAEKRRP